MKNAAKAKAVRSGLMYFKKPKLDAIRPVFMMIARHSRVNFRCSI